MKIRTQREARYENAKKRFSILEGSPAAIQHLEYAPLAAKLKFATRRNEFAPED